MEIETPDDKFKNTSYNHSSYNEWKDHLEATIDKDSHHLCLFLGIYEPNKKQALNELSSLLDREVKTVDTSTLLTQIESETYQKMDQFFDGLDESDIIIYFKNGGKLCGAYSSYSQSRIKYATPQERYFIKKIQAFNGLVIVDINEFTDADKSLRRAAQSIVSFTLPDSKLTRFFWHLKHYSFQGSVLKTKRPEAYGETV